LYIGLITDTGRFMYENTSPRAHQMAAELIEAGVDAAAVSHQLYEDMPAGKLALLGVALTQIQRFDGGRLTLSVLSADSVRRPPSKRCICVSATPSRASLPAGMSS